MYNNKLLASILFLAIIQLQLKPTQAVLGVDVSQPTSASTFSCMKSNGMSFAIVRGYCSFGGLDTHALATLQAAKGQGLITDVYHFPCIGKVSPTNQADTVMNSLKGYFGTVWLDIESNPSSGCGWKADKNANCAFLQQLVAAYKARGAIVGIYASRSQWESIMGGINSCPNFTGLPVWYAHYDGSASFSDWSSVSFGNWAKPSIKQYRGDTTLCGAGVDLNYY